jgi:hypothetical protein
MPRYAKIYGLVQQVKAPELFHSDQALPKDVPAEASGRIEQMRRLVQERPTTALTTWLGQLRGFIPVGLYAQQNPEGRGVARGSVIPKLANECVGGVNKEVRFEVGERRF